MQMPDVYCGNCGASNPYGMQFCRKCGRQLVYTQPGAQPNRQPPVPAPPPAAPVAAEAAGMMNWLPWILGGLIAGFGFLIISMVAIYLFDPFGMLAGTPTPTPTASYTVTLTGTPVPNDTPVPSATVQPSETPEPATATAYPTYTNFPTYTVPAYTATYTPTVTEEAFEFSNGAVDIPLVRYGGCAPSDVVFSVDVSSSDNVTAIVLFTRLVDPATQNYITNWTSGVSMKDKGNNHYEITQTGNALSQGADPGTVTVAYQFVDQNKQGDYIHSKNHFDLTLEKCP